MTISIVIPCHNHARFVGEAVGSALAQDWNDIEVVVVNDGSTDDSAAAIATAAARDSRVRVITQPNRGLASARNAGLDASTGTILIFLDADDRLCASAARAACESLSRQPDAMMTFGRCRLIDRRGEPMLTNLPTVDRGFYEELLRRNYIWTPAMAAFRRDAFARVGGFDPGVNPSADYDLYLRVARTLVVTRHDSHVADYRQHDANMSKNPVAMLDATLAVLDAQRSHVTRHPHLKPTYREGRRAWRAFYGEQIVEQFRSALHARRYSDALGCAFHLLRLYPRGVAHHVIKKLRLIMRVGQSGQPKSAPPPRVPPPPRAAGAGME